MACTGASSFATLMSACASAHMVSASIVSSEMVIPLAEFTYTKKDRPMSRSYIVAHNEALEYPICVYKLDDSSYTALWMKCTHQGTELQAFGDKLHCPAHGSEFSKKGSVDNGPASDPLRTFPVIVSGTELRISLK